SWSDWAGVGLGASENARSPWRVRARFSLASLRAAGCLPGVLYRSVPPMRLTLRPMRAGTIRDAPRDVKREEDLRHRRAHDDSVDATGIARNTLERAGAPGTRPERRGNPVRFRGCPAAVSENEAHAAHCLSGWEAVGARNPARGRNAREPEDL